MVIIKRMLMRYMFFFLQMANLAHRAGQLLQKQYLIIHPTADGNRHMFYVLFLNVAASETLTVKL